MESSTPHAMPPCLLNFPVQIPPFKVPYLSVPYLAPGGAKASLCQVAPNKIRDVPASAHQRSLNLAAQQSSHSLSA